MNLKELLESYGINFDSLDFTVQDDQDGVTKEEILKSMAENEIKVESRGALCTVDDFDIDDQNKETILYL